MTQETPQVPRIKVRFFKIGDITTTFCWDSVACDMTITINSVQDSLRKGKAYEGEVLHALNESIYLYTKEITG